jgi:spore coat polysaccharide biosynthesis predicted glycosyltransferase SpsG
MPAQPANHQPESPRVLFVPVSGPHGSGELMRCLIIARELQRAEPTIGIHFLLNRNAVFREAVEFTVHDCDDSPTRSTPQVLAAIRAVQPAVVVFDNAGRTVQLRAAKAAGARLVFSSRSPRLRWKAFRVTWLRLLDEHWIVFPKFVTGGLSLVERLKLRFSPSYVVRHLDTLFTPSDPVARMAWLQELGLEPGGFAVFMPGGRGDEHGANVDPAELFMAAAREYAQQSGLPAVVLTGRSAQDLPPALPGTLRLLPRVRPDEVQHLLASAALVVSNGGSTLIHALAHRQAVISVPLADDQARRIKRASRQGVVIPAPLDAGKIAATALALIRDPRLAQQMRDRIVTLGLVNGVDVAVAALRRLAHA